MNYQYMGNNQFNSKQDKPQASAKGDSKQKATHVEKDKEEKKKSEQNFSSKKKAQQTQPQQQSQQNNQQAQPPKQDNKSKKKADQKQICGMNFKCGHQCKSSGHKIDQPHKQDCNYCKQQSQFQQNNFQKKCDHVFPCGHGCTSIKENHGHHQKYCQFCYEQKQKQKKQKQQQQEQKQQEERQFKQQQSLICTKQLDCRHQCDKVHQSQQCPPCRVNFTKQFLCGHMQEYECHQSQNYQKCTFTVTQNPNCGHQYQFQCSNKPLVYICNSKCNFKLSCGHLCQAQCGQCPKDFHDPCINKVQPLYYKHFCIKENIYQVLTFQENKQFHEKYCRIYGIDFEIFSDSYRREVEIEIVIFQMAFKNKIQQLQVQDMMLYTNKLSELVKRKDLYLQLNTEQFQYAKLVLCKLIMAHMKNRIGDHVLAQFNQIKFQFGSNDVDKILRLFLNLTECIQPLLCSHPCSIRDFHLNGCSCNQTLNYYRICGHNIQTRCIGVDVNSIEKHLAPCDKICNKQMACGHKCQLKCNQKCICLESKIIYFPGCNHSKQMQCRLINNKEVCQEYIQIQLKCLHMKYTICSQKDFVQCNETREHTCLNCNKKREIMCKDYDNYQCLVQKQCQNCKKVLNIQCDSYQSCLCFQRVYEKQQLLVQDNPCYQILDCGHRCAGRLCLPKLHEYCKSKNKCQCGSMKYCNRGLCDKCNNLNPYPARNLNDQLVKLEKYGLGSLSNLIIKKNFTDFDIKNLSFQLQIIMQIHELPQLNNPKYIQVIFFLKNLTQDSELVYKINQINMEKLQLAVLNLQAYAKQDKKSFLKVGKYFNMSKIESNDFQLTRQQLNDL